MTVKVDSSYVAISTQIFFEVNIISIIPEI